MPVLTDDIKTFIVKGLACYDSPSQVAEAVRVNFDIEVTERPCDPESGRRLARGTSSVVSSEGASSVHRLSPPARRMRVKMQEEGMSRATGARTRANPALAPRFLAALSSLVAAAILLGACQGSSSQGSSGNANRSYWRSMYGDPDTSRPDNGNPMCCRHAARDSNH
jgi:hypothetical protein